MSLSMYIMKVIKHNNSTVSLPVEIQEHSHKATSSDGFVFVLMDSSNS